MSLYDIFRKLHLFVSRNNNSEFFKLVKKINNINELSEGKTLLYTACQYGNLEITKYLLSNSANPNILSFGSTNLYIATWYNHGNIVSELCKYDVEIDKTNNGTLFSPLCYAIEREYVDIVKILVASKANLNYMIDGKKTRPLHLACQKRNFEIIKILIEHNADIHSLDNYNNNPIFYIHNNFSYSKVPEPSSELIEFINSVLILKKNKNIITSKLNPNAVEWNQNPAIL
jgi:ankyrin repeat protein